MSLPGQAHPFPNSAVNRPASAKKAFPPIAFPDMRVGFPASLNPKVDYFMKDHNALNALRRKAPRLAPRLSIGNVKRPRLIG